MLSADDADRLISSIGEVVTLQNFSAEFKISVRTARRMISGGMPHVKIGRVIRVPVRSALMWIGALSPRQESELKRKEAAVIAAEIAAAEALFAPRKK